MTRQQVPTLTKLLQPPSKIQTKRRRRRPKTKSARFRSTPMPPERAALLDAKPRSDEHRGALRGTPGSACPQPEPNASPPFLPPPRPHAYIPFPFYLGLSLPRFLLPSLSLSLSSSALRSACTHGPILHGASATEAPVTQSARLAAHTRPLVPFTAPGLQAHRWRQPRVCRVGSPRVLAVADRFEALPILETAGRVIKSAGVRTNR